jgi:multimeric flavodoxin WrbA
MTVVAANAQEALATRRFLFILGSSREGNSEILARHAAGALPAGVRQDWKRLSDLPLAAFRDTGSGSRDGSLPAGNERVLLDATLTASDLVVISPLYWYNMSASVKLYLDYWGSWMSIPQVQFRSRMRGKVMWAVTATGGDPAAAHPLMESLRLSAAYLDMKWGGHIVGRGRQPGDISTEAGTLERAKTLFQEVRT